MTVDSFKLEDFDHVQDLIEHLRENVYRDCHCKILELSRIGKLLEQRYGIPPPEEAANLEVLAQLLVGEMRAVEQGIAQSGPYRCASSGPTTAV